MRRSVATLVRWKTYKITANGTVVASTSRTEDGHLICTDLPRKMGGNDDSSQPVHLLLASLCGCEQATAEFVAKHMKPPVKISSIAWELHAKRDESGTIALPLTKPLETSARPQRIEGTAWGVTD